MRQSSSKANNPLQHFMVQTGRSRSPVELGSVSGLKGGAGEMSLEASLVNFNSTLSGVVGNSAFGGGGAKKKVGKGMGCKLQQQQRGRK